MVEVIIYPDLLAAELDFLRDQLDQRDEDYAQNVGTGSYIPDVKVLPFVWSRRVGGFTTGRATDRARMDFHVYHVDEYRAQALTQLVRGLLLAWPGIDSSICKGAAEFSGPGPVPDPLWPDASRFYFTIEFVLRGHAAAPPTTS